ncbi:MAG: 2-C-methyl-D-erythritol 4-phosphate cytidylyltransferase [Candidatus Latescibacteria bacterium 4484_7]|nr:MAG: 2-C-methyl-D-erythritol 4-phosphate cytidylyltransferase [Candidatus Latescibacteria bacterium 4484_7]RKZ07927.1 MAG: 2-C-methyl-D-erythritol 4-phosphate cytidylyltransferase [bacterium]
MEKVVCILAGAGRGVRFSREMPKCFYPINDEPLLTLSLETVGAWKGVDEYIVLVPPGWEEKAEEELKKRAGDVKYRVLAGGGTRQQSVSIGLAAIDEADMVIVHDACRPIVSKGMIERVVAAAREFGAAVPALQVTETLGRLRDDILEDIVPRERVVAIQTPQAFKFDVLRKSFEVADETIRTATDESSLALKAGFEVKLVEGERWNIKVTVREDLDIITSFLSARTLDFEASSD